MKARFPGVCACGCRRPFPAGEEVARGDAGWTRTACRAPAAPAPAPSSTWFASPAEVLQVLAEARAVARREAAAAAAARRPSNLPPGLAGGSRPAHKVDAGRVLPLGGSW